MHPPHPLPLELAELIARRFRVIGDPVRIRILDRLRTGEASVGDLVDDLGGSQQNMSKHLGVLHDAGVVGRRKEGTRAIYRIADDAVLRLCDEVCGSMQRQISKLNDLVSARPQTQPTTEV